jgi:SagB-type dehydrogenase family enzyme
MTSRITPFIFLVMTSPLWAQSPARIELLPPDTGRGLPLMKTLEVRASASAFDTRELSLRDLSDLLWSANGINRPESGKRTASSAQNARDVDIYACMPDGTYRYDPLQHRLDPVSPGDHRALVAGRQTEVAVAPCLLLLVSDFSRFSSGEDSVRRVWAAIDAGIVSQNISLFCAATGLSTRPRVTMEQQKLRELLRLNESQLLLLNHPVSYRKE